MSRLLSFFTQVFRGGAFLFGTWPPFHFMKCRVRLMRRNMSSSRKRPGKKLIIKMPSRLEILKSVRGAPIPPKKVIKPKKGGKYNRLAEDRRARRDMNI